MSNLEVREAALFERLGGVVRDHSKARIARATNRSRTSVTRYMQGAKLPLEFGAALVEEFGLNPAWLLSGSQPMYLADVPASSAGLAVELLELMRSIDQVAGLKLGALTGRPHARALRDLSDTLDRYGSLSDRLNRMSVPILTDLLQQAELAVAAHRLEKARALLATASRLHRFCDDRSLTLRLLAARGLVFHYDQDLESALELRERLFHATLSSQPGFSAIAEPATGLALVLRNSQKRLAARRIARIGMAWAEPADQRTPAYSLLSTINALAGMELGEFEGVSQAIDAAAEFATDGESATASLTARTYYNLYRGYWDPRVVAGMAVPAFPTAVALLEAAYLTEDVDAIERALHRCRAVMESEVPLNRLHVQRGEAFLKALRGGAAADALPVLPGTGFVQFASLVFRGCVLRLSGDSGALAAVRDAQAVLESFPPDRTPQPHPVLLHLRNVLTLIKPGERNPRKRSLREKATALREQRRGQGFGQVRWLPD